MPEATAAQEIDFDLVVYNGEINRSGYELISQQCCTPTSKKCLLILTTYGGDPHAGFRIARALRHHFSDGLTIYVPDHCKSAGTLICIAGDELVIDDRGELGPLDVQVKKSDEILEQSSGLDIPEALNFLQSQVQVAVQTAMLTFRMRTGISTKMASGMAGEIVSRLYSEIFAQIDPMKIGELQRAIRIAFEYGERLNAYKQNLKADALGRLVAGYPSHGFVIDRKEAGTLFERVRRPNGTEQCLRDMIRAAGGIKPGSAQIVQRFDKGAVVNLLAPKPEASNGTEHQGAAGNSQGEGASGQNPAEPAQSAGNGAQPVRRVRRSRRGRSAAERGPS